MNLKFISTTFLTGLVLLAVSVAADGTPRQILFKNVNIFDGKSDNLIQGKDVLIQNNLIKSVVKYKQLMSKPVLTLLY